jgi:hypothetical protein
MTQTIDRRRDHITNLTLSTCVLLRCDHDGEKLSAKGYCYWRNSCHKLNGEAKEIGDTRHYMTNHVVDEDTGIVSILISYYDQAVVFDDHGRTESVTKVYSRNGEGTFCIEPDALIS